METTKPYSQNYWAQKQREYRLKPDYVKLCIDRTNKCMNNKYNHPDEEIRNAWREKKKQYNRTSYLRRKEKLNNP